MKLGIANRIIVTVLEDQLADTQDITPRYADVVYLYQDGSEGADSVADAWLSHMSHEDAAYP